MTEYRIGVIRVDPKMGGAPQRAVLEHAACREIHELTDLEWVVRKKVRRGCCTGAGGHKGAAMGHPAYEERREAERAEAAAHRAMSEAMREAAEGLVEFFRGRATLTITPPAHLSINDGWRVRFERDAK